MRFSVLLEQPPSQGTTGVFSFWPFQKYYIQVQTGFPNIWNGLFWEEGYQEEINWLLDLHPDRGVGNTSSVMPSPKLRVLSFVHETDVADSGSIILEDVGYLQNGRAM